jgi:hypothetical protein
MLVVVDTRYNPKTGFHEYRLRKKTGEPYKDEDSEWVPEKLLKIA